MGFPSTMKATEAVNIANVNPSSQSKKCQCPEQRLESVSFSHSLCMQTARSQCQYIKAIGLIFEELLTSLCYYILWEIRQEGQFM